MLSISAENLYLASPVWLQQAFVNIQGGILRRRRYGKLFKDALAFYQASDPREIDKLQFMKFLRAASETRYWQRRFEQYGVDVITCDDPKKEIAKLPILTKEEVKENLDAILNLNFKGKVTNVCTSGTTGSSLRFPQTQIMESRQWAIWYRYRMMHGVSLETWMGWFGGRSIASLHQNSPPYWRVSFPTRQVMFSAHHLSAVTVASYVSYIKAKKISWLHGYPSQLSLLAHLVLEKKLGGFPDVKVITVGAESLLDSQKAVIEEVFQVPVRQHYGLAEGVANISEHADGKLIPDQDFSYVEFLPLVTTDTSLCRIIGTNYNNIAFPLLRYDSGDIAMVNNCSDGLVVQKIDGRRDDYIVLPNGVKLGRLGYIFRPLTQVKEGQIFQESINKIVFRIVKKDIYNQCNQEEILLKEARRRFGGDVDIAIEYVERIEKTSNGKLRLVVSNVK